MVEEQDRLLTPNIHSNLGDKSSDKRKQAAGDLEQRVRSLLRGAAVSSDTEVRRLVRCLTEDFCSSAFPNRRKGGLIALAYTAIALDHKPIQPFVLEMVEPIVVCCADEDATVRLGASEAFYNVAKVARGGILPQLAEIFNCLCRLCTDVDQTVKDGAQCLDRLVRDVVTERRDFDYSSFVPELTTRIRVLNPSVRQLVLGWIILLESLPQVDMIVYLPQYLEGLFGVLASENRDIRHSADVCLEEILDKIRNSATERPARAQRAVAEAASTVARCCRSGGRRPEDNYVRLISLHWLLEFVKLQVDLEGSSAGSGATGGSPGEHPSPNDPSTQSSSQRLRAVKWLPPRGGTQAQCATPEAPSRRGQGGLRELVPKLLAGALYCLDDGEAEIRQNAEQANTALRDAARSLGGDLPVEPLASAVLDAMRDGVDGQNRSQEVLLKCFGWAELLLSKCPARVLELPVRDQLLDAALLALQRPEEEVASASLCFAARLAASSDRAAPVAEADEAGAAEEELEKEEEDEDLFARICRRVFQLLAERPDLLTSRGELVVRRLCDGVDAERFFATAARAASAEKDKVFARNLVQVLNRGLLTGRETRQLRAKLRAEAARCAAGHATAVGSLPGLLLTAWMHCPVSSLALSLWLHWFELSEELAIRLTRLEVTEELQEQLQEFVELLDSPVFTSVRLQLLEARRLPSLLRTVLHLGALLPEERALRARLQVVETALLLDRLQEACPTSNASAQIATSEAMAWISRFDAAADAHCWKEHLF